MILIDNSLPFSLDATHFSAVPLTDVSFDVSTPYAGDLAEYTVRLMTSVPVDVERDCYVKYIFADIKEVQVAGMLTEEK